MDPSEPVIRKVRSPYRVTRDRQPSLVAAVSYAFSLLLKVAISCLSSLR